MFIYQKILNEDNKWFFLSRKIENDITCKIVVAYSENLNINIFLNIKIKNRLFIIFHELNFLIVSRQ